MRSTYTYATMDVSKAAFDEIKTKLTAAGYEDQIRGDGDGLLIIDMHGIALTLGEE